MLTHDSSINIAFVAPSAFTMGCVKLLAYFKDYAVAATEFNKIEV